MPPQCRVRMPAAWLLLQWCIGTTHSGQALRMQHRLPARGEEGFRHVRCTKLPCQIPAGQNIHVAKCCVCLPAVQPCPFLVQKAPAKRSAHSPMAMQSPSRC